MTTDHAPPPFTCDIFCRVVDNFGDIGVCWRLARQLAQEFAISTRLIVDDLPSFRAIAPGIDPSLTTQIRAGVEILNWSNAHLLAASDCVIEAFACEIPHPYLSAMANRAVLPVWINLEYLSAEKWVESHHLMPSPHPRLPLTKTFFFPGFTAQTGGILRTRNAPNPAPILGLETVPGNRVYFLGYPNAAIGALLNAMRDQHCLFAEGPLARTAQEHGARVSTHAFVAQEDFDTLLAQQDICFVRGEDSFIRAQLLGKPFIWQIYPQADDAHLTKLNAFLDLYCAQLTPHVAEAVRGLWLTWNQENGAAIGAAWHDFVGHLPEIRHQAQAWAVHLAQQPDLATNLVNFVVTALAKSVKI